MSNCRNPAVGSLVDPGSPVVRQVSKEGATGEMLAPGAFSVKGLRHFLPPHPLVMGLGFLFVVDAASAAAHAGERAVKTADAAAPAPAAAAAAAAAGDQEKTGAHDFITWVSPS